MKLTKTKGAIGALIAVASTLAMQAYAAVPAGVTTELETSKTDVTTIGTAVFAVVVAIVIFKWFRRAL